MIMIKRILCILLCIPLFLSLNAHEQKSSLYYLKLGTTFLPGNLSIILPTAGIGARFQKNHRGFDLSANLSSMLFINYASIKGVFLFYPKPEKKNQLYLGFGPGIGYQLSFAPMGGSFGNASSSYACANLEGILGYEFRRKSHLKPFLQVELSQPTLKLSHSKHRSSLKPGVALAAGIGF